MQWALNAAVLQTIPSCMKWGAAPLQCFFDVGVGGVHELANVLEDRLRKVGGLGNVGIDAQIFLGRLGAPLGAAKMAAIGLAEVRNDCVWCQSLHDESCRAQVAPIALLAAPYPPC